MNRLSKSLQHRMQKAVVRQSLPCAHKGYYSTRQLAKHAARTFSKLHNKHLDFYRCPHCGMYHLTTVKD